LKYKKVLGKRKIPGGKREEALSTGNTSSGKKKDDLPERRLALRARAYEKIASKTRRQGKKGVMGEKEKKIETKRS